MDTNTTNTVNTVNNLLAGTPEWVLDEAAKAAKVDKKGNDALTIVAKAGEALTPAHRARLRVIAKEEIAVLGVLLGHMKEGVLRGLKPGEYPAISPVPTPKLEGVKGWIREREVETPESRLARTMTIAGNTLAHLVWACERGTASYAGWCLARWWEAKASAARALKGLVKAEAKKAHKAFLEAVKAHKAETKPKPEVKKAEVKEKVEATKAEAMPPEPASPAEEPKVEVAPEAAEKAA